MLGHILSDLRFALRALTRQPLSSAMALVVLTLGMACAIASYCVLNGLLYRPLPFPESDRLVVISNFRAIEFDLRKESPFSSWVHDSPWQEMSVPFRMPNVNVGTGNGTSARAMVTETSAQFFELFGQGRRWEAGRAFLPGDDSPGRNRVAVIGPALAHQLFGGVPDRVIGRSIEINGIPFSVIGVASAEWNFPAGSSIWIPTYFESKLIPRTDQFFGTVVARLRKSMPFRTAELISAAEFERLLSGNSSYDPARRVGIKPLRTTLIGSAKEASVLLMALTAILLLIACGGVAELLLARISERRGEIALRLALGANRKRIFSQLLTESLALTSAASLAALLLASWLITIARKTNIGVAEWENISVWDWPVVWFAVGCALLTGVVFAVLPWMLIEVWGRGRNLLRGHAGSLRAGPVLVVLQTALSIVLVGGALKISEGFLHLASTDLGFRTHNVVSLSVSLLGSNMLADPERAVDYYRRTIGSARNVVGVTSASAAEILPLTGQQSVRLERFVTNTGRPVEAVPVAVAPGYFDSLGIPFVAGRDFEDRETAKTEKVAIVNDRFVLEMLGGDTAFAGQFVGRTIISPWEPNTSLRIVGVVKSSRLTLLKEPLEQVFVPISQRPPQSAHLIVSFQGKSAGILPMIRNAVQECGPEIPVFDVQPLESRFDQHLLLPRLLAYAAAWLGGVSVLLSVFSAYGVADRSMVRQTREMGIRLALGASPSGLRRRIVAIGLRPVLIAIVAGVVGSWWLQRYVTYISAIVQVRAGLRGVLIASAFLTAVHLFTLWTAGRRIVRMDASASLRVE